jgi:hypothetical protein
LKSTQAILVIEDFSNGGSKLKSSSDPDSRSLHKKVESDELIAPISEVIIVNPCELVIK